MNYEIVTTEDFNKNVKPLLKKYRSLPDDLETFKKELLKNPTMGDDLGDNIRKVRMAIASKNKGKRGGARVITCTVLVDVENS
jgi:mRNA-degrading endonuclease RelE of RelBE toxin-antitoxin system